MQVPSTNVIEEPIVADDQNNPLNQPQDNAGAAPADNQFASPQPPAQDPVSSDQGASVDPQGALNVEHSSGSDAAVPTDPALPAEPAAPVPGVAGGADPVTDLPVPPAPDAEAPSSDAEDGSAPSNQSL